MKIHIPTPLRVYTEQQAIVSVQSDTVDDALEILAATYPDLKPNLFGADGKLRSFVNIYLNDDDVRYLPEKELTKTQDSDEITIIPSIAGGCCR